MTYHDELVAILSDMYKDVHGFRPRHYNYSQMTEVDLQAEISQLSVELDEHLAAEAARREQSVRDFETAIANTIVLGAGDRETAIRWLQSAVGNTLGECEYHYNLPRGYLGQEAA